MSKVVNIIGAGLAGSLTARVFRRAGVECRVIDDGDVRSGSVASSNLYIASWLKKFMEAETKNGVAVVESLFGDLIDKPFSGGIAAAMNVKHIGQRHILVEPDIRDKVIQVDSTGSGQVLTEHGLTFSGPTVLCTGYRAALEIIALPVWVKAGHCFLFEGTLAPGQSRLAIISPYRHEKLYQFEPGLIYYADSVAIKLSEFGRRQEELKATTLARARKHIGDLSIREYRVGYRPFVDGADFGYLSEVKQNVWAINGGGKNGIVAYADKAARLLPIVQERLVA